MIYTNLYNLPEPFERAVRKVLARYHKGTPLAGTSRIYSTTELIKPARPAALERAHDDRIVVDVSDCMYLLDGALSHAMLEAAGVEDTGAVILEERLFAELDGITVSGAMDCALIYPTGKISDYKKTSVGKLMRNSLAEWTQQLNIYAWLSAVNGRSVVTELEVVAWLRDWMVVVAQRSTNGYPPRGVMTVPVDLWSSERTVEFLRSRIAEHVAADECIESAGDECLPLCTDEERWIRNKQWAVMKPGRKSAVRVLDERGEADLLAETIVGSWIEQRGGEPTRCISWCDAGKAGLCSQWNAERVLYEGTNNLLKGGE